MRKLLIALSGARPEIIARCPSEQGRFLATGGTVLVSGVLAAILLTGALSGLLGIGLPPAIAIGLLWGSLDVALNQWLLSGMAVKGRAHGWRAVPRVFLAIPVGALITGALMLQVYKPVIDARVTATQQRRAAEFAAVQQKSRDGQEAQRLRMIVDELRYVIDSGGDSPLDPDNDPKTRALIAERDAQLRVAERYHNEWRCQLSNGPACLPGVRTKDRKRVHDAATRRVAEIQRQIYDRLEDLGAATEAGRRERVNAARSQLPESRAALAAAERRMEDERAAFNETNGRTDGLLSRLQALDEASKASTSLRTAALLLYLMVVLVECLPVIVRLMQRPGFYEKVLALVERQELLAVRSAHLLPGLRLGPSGDDSSLRQIWDPSAADPPHAAPAQRTVPRPVDASPGSTGADPKGSAENAALLGMPDARVTRGADRSGFALFPDDD